MAMQVEILKGTTFPALDIKRVYQACKWGWPEADEPLLKAMCKSHLCAIAYERDEPVGFCRVISDGYVYALVVDTLVVPSSRKKGIGTLLIQTALAELKKDGITFVKLISSEEGRPLYEKCGFEVCSNAAPGMILSLR
jgi:GNAT superfamily N-acetyltransferase